MMATIARDRIDHRAVEDFLFHEAELIDGWKLMEWAALFTEDAMYEVGSLTSADPVNDDPKKTLFLIADPIDRIRGRASRLLKPTAHAEYPRSKTRHMIANVRLRDSDGSDDEYRVRANMVVFRTKEDRTTQYMGECHYRLVVRDGELRIRSKRIVLDLNSLYDQGRLTIIL